MPYKVQKPNSCKICFKPILRGSTFCQKHVPKTKEWKAKIGKSLSITKKGMPGKRGEESNGWKGGKIITTGGYIYILSPDHPYKNITGYVMEHRLVMEKNIGRFINKGEEVHHKNGNRKDNRIENLQLLSSKEHAVLHASTKSRGKKGRFIS